MWHVLLSNNFDIWVTHIVNSLIGGPFPSVSIDKAVRHHADYVLGAHGHLVGPEPRGPQIHP